MKKFKEIQIFLRKKHVVKIVEVLQLFAQAPGTNRYISFWRHRCSSNSRAPEKSKQGIIVAYAVAIKWRYISDDRNKTNGLEILSKPSLSFVSLRNFLAYQALILAATVSVDRRDTDQRS